MEARDVGDAEALARRWTAFLESTTRQLEVLLAEAEGVFEAAIAQHTQPPDAQPPHTRGRTALAEASRELTERLAGLERAVDATWGRLELDIDALVVATGDTRLYARREALEGLRWELHGLLERRGEEFLVRKAGKAGRTLAAAAEAEREEVRRRGVPCSRCGTALHPTVLHAPSLVTCPGCKVMSEVPPPPLTERLLAGDGLDAVACEAAWGAGLVLREAEGRLEALDAPTETDALAYEAAALTYWRTFVEARGRATPGWSPDRRDAEVELRMVPLRERARRALRRTPSFLWEVATRAGARPRRPTPS